MGGIFSKANRPKLSGAYVNFERRATATIPVQPGSVVAIPFTHDWGPLNEVVRTRTFAEWQAIFGGSDDTPAYRAVKQAFLGENVEGRGGAGEIVSFRMGGADVAAAEITLQNTSPADAITLTARYEGSRGNDLRVTTRDHAADANLNELLIYDGTVLLEQYVYADTDITDLAAQINGTGNYQGRGSDWVVASGVTSGTALANVTSQALTDGDDGSTLVAGDWTAMIEALDVEDFSVFVPFDLTDSGILASLRTWVADSNQMGKRFRAIFGGAADETAQDAIDRAGSLADPNILTVGVGTVTDETLGPDGTEIDLSTSQLAPRVAGILATRGEHQSLSGARIAGVRIKSGPTLAEQVTLFDEGVISLARDSFAAAPVHIATGNTTWTQADANADPSRPYREYRNPKYVATMGGIEMDLSRYADSINVRGKAISPAVRDAVAAKAKEILLDRQSQGVIQPGWTVGIDQNPPPTDEDEFIALQIGVKFAPSLEQLFFTVSIG